ncbi:MAG: circularly permuted type 2 ATP-grasp protein [Myxococcaceae bacterium]
MLFKINPGLKEKLPELNDIDDYFRAVVDQARAQANPPNGKIVIYMVPPFEDNESNRLAKVMARMGVEMVTPKGRQLSVTEDGVFMRATPDAEPEPVGFIFLNGEHRWIDASHPLTRRAFFMTEAEEVLDAPETTAKVRAQIKAALMPDPVTGEVNIAAVERALKKTDELDLRMWRDARAIPGLMDAIAQGKVGTDYTPGIDFMGDKEFKLYVDDLVRHYLREEPLLPSIPVHSFVKTVNGETVLDETQFSRFLEGAAYKENVFKIVNGRGGKGVYIGPKMSAKDVQELRELIRANPSMYVVEPFIPISRHDGKVVDLRMISAVTEDGVIVANPPWCRGVPQFSGNGKVNISDRGVEIAAVVRSPKKTDAPG